jgi:hypothetical protein
MAGNAACVASTVVSTTTCTKICLQIVIEVIRLELSIGPMLERWHHPVALISVMAPRTVAHPTAEFGLDQCDIPR